MIYTSKVQQAIRLAVKVHQIDQNQTRFDKQTPYIIHPLTVAFILARVNAEEDIIVAGILHDVLEDSTEKEKITLKFLSKKFGEAVAKIVSDVSEKDITMPKKQRKLLAISHISKMSHASLLVKSADQLQNMTDLLNDYHLKGQSVFNNKELSKEEALRYYKLRIQALNNAWPLNPLLPELNIYLKQIISID